MQKGMVQNCWLFTNSSLWQKCQKKLPFYILWWLSVIKLLGSSSWNMVLLHSLLLQLSNFLNAAVLAYESQSWLFCPAFLSYCTALAVLLQLMTCSLSTQFSTNTELAGSEFFLSVSRLASTHTVLSCSRLTTGSMTTSPPLFKGLVTVRESCTSFQMLLDVSITIQRVLRAAAMHTKFLGKIEAMHAQPPPPSLECFQQYFLGM